MSSWAEMKTKVSVVSCVSFQSDVIVDLSALFNNPEHLSHVLCIRVWVDSLCKMTLVHP